MRNVWWEDFAFPGGFLSSSGITSGIERRKNPKGKGSDFDYVRNVFAEEVKALSNPNLREGRGVLTLMDEDGQGIESRRSLVATHLAGLDLLQADCSQGRCLVLTKRNVETWVYWLTGSRLSEDWEISETENYKTIHLSAATRKLNGKD